MKFGEWVDYRSETSSLNFGSDSEHVLHIVDIISLHISQQCIAIRGAAKLPMRPLLLLLFN